MKSARTTLAYAAAIALVAFGLLALLNPLVAVRIVGLEVVEPRGLSEVRASYGAMLLAFGGVMIWAVPMRPRSAPWLRFAGVLFAAAALGRGASVLLDGVWTPVNLLVVAFEALVAAAFLIASFQTPSRRDRTVDASGPPARPSHERDDASRTRPRRGLLGRRKRKPRAADREPGSEDGSDTSDEDAASDPLRALRS